MNSHKEISSCEFILNHLKGVKQQERESLKRDLFNLRNKLYDEKIILPIDFTPYGKNLSSDVFNQDISFLVSIGLIEEKIENSMVLYKTTPRGDKHVF